MAGARSAQQRYPAFGVKGFSAKSLRSSASLRFIDLRIVSPQSKAEIRREIHDIKASLLMEREKLTAMQPEQDSLS